MAKHFVTNRGIVLGYEKVPAPQILKDIQNNWKHRANVHGDEGSCVIGAGFRFVYEGNKYWMPPTSQWQGSCSWEAYKDVTEKELAAIGCTEIYYEWGNMD